MHTSGLPGKFNLQGGIAPGPSITNSRGGHVGRSALLPFKHDNSTASGAQRWGELPPYVGRLRWPPARSAVLLPNSRSGFR